MITMGGTGHSLPTMGAAPGTPSPFEPMIVCFVINRLGLFQRHRSVDHELAGRAGDGVRRADGLAARWSSRRGEGARVCRPAVDTPQAPTLAGAGVGACGVRCGGVDF